MPFTAAAKRLMLDALRGVNPTTPVSHIGLATKGPTKSFSATAVDDVFTSNAHGFADGDVLLIASLTGGSGLTVGRVYFVRDSTANTFKVATSPAGTAVDVLSDVTSGSANEVIEISGGSPAYSRKPIAFNAAVDPGTMDDSTNGVTFDIPALGVVDYVTFHDAISGGILLGVDDVPQEVYNAQGTYTANDADLDLLAVA